MNQHMKKAATAMMDIRSDQSSVISNHFVGENLTLIVNALSAVGALRALESVRFFIRFLDYCVHVLQRYYGSYCKFFHLCLQIHCHYCQNDESTLVVFLCCRFYRQ
jgi:hypothetical protein